MYAQHNAARSANGVAPLQIDAGVTEVARQRARHMARTGEFTHDPPTGQTYTELLKAAGISYRGAGENIAYNTYDVSKTVDVAMEGLLQSPGHRANILRSSFTRVGIGVAIEGGKKYYAIVFMTP